jgi:hypothetical protein
MENTNTNQDIQKIREHMDKNRKDKEAAGVIQLILLPVWIWLVYQAVSNLL